MGWGSKAARAESDRADKARDKELRKTAREAREDAAIYRGMGMHREANAAFTTAHGADLERGRKR